MLSTVGKESFGCSCGAVEYRVWITDVDARKWKYIALIINLLKRMRLRREILYVFFLSTSLWNVNV